MYVWLSRLNQDILFFQGNLISHTIFDGVLCISVVFLFLFRVINSMVFLRLCKHILSFEYFDSYSVAWILKSLKYFLPFWRKTCWFVVKIYPLKICNCFFKGCISLYQIDIFQFKSGIPPHFEPSNRKCTFVISCYLWSIIIKLNLPFINCM